MNGLPMVLTQCIGAMMCLSIAMAASATHAHAGRFRDEQPPFRPIAALAMIAMAYIRALST
jgi:uncharacterized protein involved in response to NO